MTTLFGAILLALAADDASTAAALTQAGGKVKSDPSGLVTEVHFRDSSVLTPDHYRSLGELRKLRVLVLYGRCSLTDETLALLSRLESLQDLSIDGAKITDEGMKALSSLTALRKLMLYHILMKDRFTGSGVSHLASLPNLDTFGCGGSSFNDQGMAACATLPRLRELRVWHTQATDTGVARLASMTTLKVIHLGPQFTPKIGDASMAPLASIKSLETVSVMETRLTWEKGLSLLKALPALKLLELHLDEISEADLATAKAELPGVKVDWKPPTDEQRGWLRRNFRK